MDNSLPNDTETVEVDTAEMPPAPEIQDNEDGTSTILLDDPNQSNATDSDWFANLAETMLDGELDRLARKYLELIEQDMDARKERDDMQAAGLKKAGLGDPAPGGADFEGASRVTHPVLMEAYIDFAASSIKELFPPNGPVRSKVEGKPNKEKMDRAKRKAEFMNWQLTTKIKSYRPELERLLTQLPVGGSQYMKIYWDESKNSANAEFIPIDDIVLPYEAKNFFSLQRKFHRIPMSEFEYEKRVACGSYVDMSLPISYGGLDNETESEKQTAKIEGKRNDYSSDNNNRLIYEGCVYDEISDDKAPEDKAVPYLITIDEQSRKVLSLYRNWDEDDKDHEELEYIVDFNFIPWRGVFGLSLLQCLAGLPDALTGALRALMDSALISNMQGGMKLKGLPGGASLSISPTQIQELDTGGMTDDIRKVFMAIPFNPPSPMLFQLLGFLTESAKSVVGTAEEKIADASNNMPVGTALALIEQGAKVFSAIHARLHDSQKRCLEILHRIDRDHLPEKFQYGTDPEDYVTREDFEGSMDVHPVSDPNIFSETQRFAQIQFVISSVMQAAAVAPAVLQLFDMRKLYARAFEMAKIPDYEDFLPAAPEAVPMNPVDENINMVMGKPVKAFAGQNHEAHIQVLLDFAKNPLFGQSPIIATKFGPAALNHLMDHLLTWYGEMMKADAAQQIGQAPDAVDWDDNASMSIALAKAAPVVDKAAQLAFAKIPALIAQGMQQLQAMAPKPPQDPMIALEGQRIQGQQQIEQGKLSLEQQKIQSDLQSKAQIAQQKAQEAQMDYELAMQKMGIEAQTALRTQNLQSQTDISKTIHDNLSAQKIAAMKIASDDSTRLSDGASLNQGG